MSERNFWECDQIAQILSRTVDEGEKNGISPALGNTIESLRKTLNVALLTVFHNQADALDCDRYDELYKRTAELLKKIPTSAPLNPSSPLLTSADAHLATHARAVDILMNQSLPSEKEKICIEVINEALHAGVENICDLLGIPQNAVSKGLGKMYKKYLSERVHGRTLAFIKNENFADEFVDHFKMQVSMKIKSATEIVTQQKGRISSCTIISGGQTRGKKRNEQIRRGKRR